MNTRKDLELTILGQVLTHPGLMVELLRTLREDNFKSLEGRRLFGAMVLCWEKHKGLDAALLGSSYSEIHMDISRALELGYSDAFFVPHMRALIEQTLYDLAGQKLRDLAGRFSEQSEDVFELLAEANEALIDLRDRVKVTPVVPGEVAVDEALARVDAVRSGEVKANVQWGFADLDRLSWIEQTDFIVIAAPEKTGKTILGLQILKANAKRGIPGLYWSSEMKRSQLFMRLALIESGVNYTKLMNNLCTKEEYAALQKALKSYRKLPIFVRDGVFNVLDVMAESESFIRRKGVKLIVVDYIQRIVPVSKKADNRERDIANIATGLKNVALTYDTPVVALSQVNEDLRARESRVIEHEMDKMITLHREEGAELADVKLRQRFGKGGDFGDVKLRWEPDHGFWQNAAIEERVVPLKRPERVQDGMLPPGDRIEVSDNERKSSLW